MFNLTYDKQEVAITHQDYHIFVTNKAKVMISNTLDYSNHPPILFEEKTLKILISKHVYNLII